MTSDRPSGRAGDDLAYGLVSTYRVTEGGADGGTRQPTTTGGAISPLPSATNELTQRDQLIIRSLQELHYMTARQIERLIFVGHASAHAAARASRRTLKALVVKGLLHRLERRIGGVRAGSASYVYGLTPRGHRVVGQTTRRRSREPSLLHLQHVLAVAEIVVRVVERTRLDDQIKLLAIRGEPSCWRPFLAAHGGSGLLKPDLRLVLRNGQQELHWFVELDRGSEHRPVIRRKLTSYVSAWKDGGEQAEHGVFPRVLWVVPSPRRGAALKEVFDQYTGLPDGMCLVATEDRSIDVLAAGVPS